MTDSRPKTAQVDVVPGEMQPWTDYDGRGPARGPVLRALLDDVLASVPDGARALVAGPHGTDLIEAVADRCREVSVLVRSVSDAGTLSEQLGGRENVGVVAGALDGLASNASDRYDVVVAADGLDRVLGADSKGLDWPARLAALAGLAAPEATVVVGLENEFAVTALLDRRVPDERHGDEEWRPLHDDPARPTSERQFSDALAAAGLTAAATYASYGTAAVADTLLAVDEAARTRPGRWPAALARQALEATPVPLLAPAADPLAAAARAGLLGAVATGFVAVCGTGGHAIYGRLGDSVVVADAGEQAWTVEARPGTPAEGRPLRQLTDEMPGSVPDADSAEAELLRLAAAEDVPGFRTLAAALGEAVRRDESAGLPYWDDLYRSGDGFAAGPGRWAADREIDADERLAAAWLRFGDRLLQGHHRHPWPPWMAGDDLVAAWLEMSGAGAEALKAGRLLADELRVVVDGRAEEAAEPDLRTALADAERARTEAFELAGQVAGLERTIGFRDKQLLVREDLVRNLRASVQKLTRERQKLIASRTYKLADAMRGASVVVRPKRIARAAKRRLRESPKAMNAKRRLRG